MAEPTRRSPRLNIMPDYLTLSSNGSVYTITLARPDLHNAFNDDMMRELTAAYREVGGRQDVRAVILAGEGKSFCAGADVHWMKRMIGYSFEENVADANVLADMLHAIRLCPKPTLARVHGAAYGGGVGLVAACDMAVASSNATFCLSEVKLGIVPAVISPFVLEKIGLSAARRYALTAERFDAAEARRIGLVSEAVETTEALDEWIGAIVTGLSANGPEAVSACKQILREVARMTCEGAQTYTTQAIARIRVSPEGQEGLKAFLEKRKPNWTA